MSAQPAPRPELTSALSLLATIELAVRNGDWIVDGCCDPDGLINGLNIALEEEDTAKAVHLGSVLARECLNAIEDGHWRPQAGVVAFLASIASPPQIHDSSLLAI